MLFSHSNWFFFAFALEMILKKSSLIYDFLIEESFSITFRHFCLQLLQQQLGYEKKLNSNTFDHVLIVSVLCKKLQANSIANGYKNSFAHVPLYATFVHVSIDCNFRYIKSLLNNFSLEKNPFYGNTIIFLCIVCTTTKSIPNGISFHTDERATKWICKTWTIKINFLNWTLYSNFYCSMRNAIFYGKLNWNRLFSSFHHVSDRSVCVLQMNPFEWSFFFVYMVQIRNESMTFPNLCASWQDKELKCSSILRLCYFFWYLFQVL